MVESDAEKLAREILRGDVRGYVNAARDLASLVVDESERRRSAHAALRMTKRPTVGLDVDGPLADFTGAYLDAAFAVTGVRIPLDVIDRWAIHEVDAFAIAATQAGMPIAELKKKCDAAVSEARFCERIRVQDGAVEAVQVLKEVAEIFAITSPWGSSQTWMHERTAWLWQHFKIPSNHVIHAGQKHNVHFDVFVDDKPSHVRAWRDAWPDGRAILFGMHHNLTAAEAEGLTVGGWGDAIMAARTVAGMMTRAGA